jgi:molecular chaperone GrpE
MDDALANELNSDDSVSGMQHLDDDINADEGSEKLKKELDEIKDKYLRLVAEFDNFRRRNAKERIEMSAVAGRDVIVPLLEVLDDSERAEKQMESITDVEVLKEGVKLVFNKLRNSLHQKGLRKADVMNEPFDADIHEAITEIPAPSEDMAGKILDVIEPAYYLNDKLIRYAKVIVGK